MAILNYQRVQLPEGSMPGNGGNAVLLWPKISQDNHRSVQLRSYGIDDRNSNSSPARLHLCILPCLRSRLRRTTVHLEGSAWWTPQNARLAELAPDSAHWHSPELTCSSGRRTPQSCQSQWESDCQDFRQYSKSSMDFHPPSSSIPCPQWYLPDFSEAHCPWQTSAILAACHRQRWRALSILQATLEGSASGAGCQLGFSP